MPSKKRSFFVDIIKSFCLGFAEQGPFHGNNFKAIGLYALEDFSDEVAFYAVRFDDSKGSFHVRAFY